MAKALVYWEKHFFMSDDEVLKNLKKYHHTCLSFDVDFEIVNADGSFPESFKSSFKIYNELESALKDDELYILLEPENKQLEVPNLLPTYEHPQECTYVIWSEFGTIPFDKFKNKQYLAIPTKENTCPLWSHTALSIVLYDRWNK